MKAIVVDDEPSNLEILQLTLELIGLEVHAFSDGRNLVPKAREIVPSIILLDIDLGEYDGRELCKVIKSTSRLTDAELQLIFERFTQLTRSVDEDE
ncbi:MAG: response regulator [Pedobacter sp.]|nr:MAG: response regulator [Pedobacter sp.]